MEFFENPGMGIFEDRGFEILKSPAIGNFSGIGIFFVGWGYPTTKLPLIKI